MKNDLTGEELLKAHEALKAKQQAIRQQRVNTLESVKRLVVSDLTAAIGAARELEGVPEFSEAVEILKGQGKQDEKCPGCNDLLPIIFSMAQLRYVTGRCFTCDEIQREKKLDAEKDRVKKNFMGKLPEHVSQRGIPKRFVSATIGNAPAPYCNMQSVEVNSLYLTGERGVGKTYLACALAIYLIENVKPVVVNDGFREVIQIPISSLPLFVSVPDLLLDIRDSFKNDSETTEKKIIEKYSTVPVLILDDLGVEKTSDWVLQTLYTMINRRYENELTTIITSNLSLQELADKIGDRIASRIAEMCQVKILKGEDRRLKR